MMNASFQSRRNEKQQVYSAEQILPSVRLFCTISLDYCCIYYKQVYHYSMAKSLVAEAHAFLESTNTAVLATSYLNLPYASTIYYSVDHEFNFYFITKPNAEKSFNLKTNKNVALVVGFGPKHISVQVRGHAAMLKDEKQRKKAINLIEAAIGKEKAENIPIRKLGLLQGKSAKSREEIVYKITPQHIVFFNLDDKAYPLSLSEKSHSIIPLFLK